MRAGVEGRASGRGAAWKIVASVVVVCGAVGFLLSRSIKEGAQHYRHVDEVMAQLGSMRNKRLQVHGNVVNDSIEQVKGSLQYRFKIESRTPRPSAIITARYTGIVPDTFKSGAEIVANGTLGPDDVLMVVPDGIMAKCPSKYDTKSGSALSAGASASAPEASKL